MSDNERKNVSEIQVGDKFKSKWINNTYEVVSILEDGKFVVYKKPSGSGYGVTKGEIFTSSYGEYKLVVPFFEDDATYRYVTYNGSVGSTDYKILHVTEKDGKRVALYMEIEGDDRWFGAFTESDFARYKKVSA